MTLNEIGDLAVDGAKLKGFNVAETGPEIDQKLLLIVSEITEAQDELRKGKAPNEIYFWPDENGENKPEGFGMELADAIIREVQLAVSLGIDIDYCVKTKMEYNKKRPFRHGKKF